MAREAVTRAEAFMFGRHDLRDDHWDRIRHPLPGQAGGHGGVGSDTRLFANVIRYLAKSGIAWADKGSDADANRAVIAAGPSRASRRGGTGRR